MSIPMNSVCAKCFFAKRFDRLLTLGTDEQATEMGKKMMQMYLDAPAGTDSSVLGGLVDKAIAEFYGIDPDAMREEKRLSNEFALGRIEKVRAIIGAQDDPLYAGLQFAVLGNYLDFSALHGQVSFEKLDEMLEKALEIGVDKDIYEQFCSDLQKGKKLLYVTDNAGEIVFDRVLGEIISEKFPHLEITYLVRGAVAANDATREDAKTAGITFPVIDNGLAIGGTPIEMCSKEAQDALNGADVILAKGMGNTESMFGCGLNVYYAFLVKCVRFVQFFEKEMMTPMFIKDACC